MRGPDPRDRVGIATGIALAAMSLQFGQVLYAQLALIVGFIAILKIKGNQMADTVKV